MNVVEKGDTVKVRFSSRTSEGIPFESPEEGETETVTIGEGKINPEFEDALTGMSPGEKKTVELPCEKAYGKCRKTLILRLKRKKLDLAEEPEPGKYLKISLDGKEAGFVKVLKVAGSYIVVDANHPMAGEDMIYELEIIDIISKGDSD
ncbi:FKBP-type peptidyl-prolyl cis-trans isomerase [Methanolacinia petrolearia]|uniref:FKBP-type peptidyl-prolyl cis-trans isomerase n=1 Tax=Methanolacinia petrolearia TaxID=54120 RepID=UPI003BAA88A9